MKKIDIKGFALEPYRTGSSRYMEIGEATECTDCGQMHELKVISTIEYHICEKTVSCPKCGHTAYFAYGQVQLYINGISYQAYSDDDDNVIVTRNDNL